MLTFGYSRRLHYSWQYRRFFDKSEVIRLSTCTIFRIPNGLTHFRLGITLKARGSSLDRNRTKRQIREGFRLLGSTLGCYDYNIVIPGHKKLVRPFPKVLRVSLQTELPKWLSSR